jgi:hypothetical protein
LPEICPHRDCGIDGDRAFSRTRCDAACRRWSRRGRRSRSWCRRRCWSRSRRGCWSRCWCRHRSWSWYWCRSGGWCRSWSRSRYRGTLSSTAAIAAGATPRPYVPASFHHTRGSTRSTQTAGWFGGRRNARRRPALTIDRSRRRRRASCRRATIAPYTAPDPAVSSATLYKRRPAVRTKIARRPGGTRRSVRRPACPVNRCPVILGKPRISIRANPAQAYTETQHNGDGIIKAELTVHSAPQQDFTPIVSSDSF